MTRLLVIPVIFVAQLCAADGFHDAEFDKVPFSRWLAGGEQAQFKWTERVLPVLLSVHQRLLARMQVQLDGAEAAKRRGEGELIFYFQLTDSHGLIYQDHTSYDLAKVEEGLKAQDLVCTSSAFVLPGDYSVALAIYYTATKEHSVKKTKLHVAPLKIDPLPQAWSKLPPVEFLEPSEPPDHWFLPKIEAKLNLPLASKRPLRIDVLLNLTPSQQRTRNYGVQDQNLSIMLPTLKVLSQLTAPGLTINAALLDLSRRRTTFHQEDVHDLDWDKIKASLSDANSGSIDVKSLADRAHNAAFFLSEIEKRFAQHTRVVIVLSSPMVFDADQEFPDPPHKLPPDCRLYYIRIQNPPSRVTIPEPGMGRRRGPGGFSGRPRGPEGDQYTLSTQMDQLEPLLKPLEPHLFDVMSAEQLRKALATIIAEISNL